jgi:molybdopterin-guanine dinucleotide biosynthesis protein B
MKVFGIAGYSGSGKTTLLVRLLPLIIARGLSVSTLKHAHHTFEIDRPGKDSHSHRQAGATEVMIASARRWALIHEIPSDPDRGPEPSVEELVAHMTPVDLLLIEGFKDGPHAKLEVHREATGKPLLQPDDRHIVAIASDIDLEASRDIPVPRLALDDTAAIADFVLAHCGLDGARA